MAQPQQWREGSGPACGQEKGGKNQSQIQGALSAVWEAEALPSQRVLILPSVSMSSMPPTSIIKDDPINR